MSLLNIFKPKPKIDWQKRKDLLIQLELIWGSVWDYRFGQFISKVFDTYRNRSFGMERVRYIDDLSDTEWLNLLHFCSRDPNWKMREYDSDQHPADRSPERIPEFITHLGYYWNKKPSKSLGEVVSLLCDTNQENMYLISDKSLKSTFSFKG